MSIIVSEMTNGYSDDKYSGGKGTLEEPYQISCEKDITEMGLNADDYDNHFILTKDIVLSNTYGCSIIAQNTPFTGTFDGNGNEINYSIIAPDQDNVGLFGQVINGEIFDLRLVANVNGQKNVGAVVGYNRGDICDVHVTGRVCGKVNIGGISGCSITSSSGIFECSTDAGVYGEENTIGGITGFNSGVISGSFSFSDVAGGTYSVGGLVGDNRGEVENCYAAAEVSSGTTKGGLVGYNNGSIVNCYAYSIIDKSVYAGGLVGQNYQGTVVNSFWDKDVSGLDNSAGGEGKTSEDMKSISLYANAGWSISNSDGNDIAWCMQHANEDYPRFSWQKRLGVDIAGQWGIGLDDLEVFADNWLIEESVPADFYSDGKVDLLDFAHLANNWMESYSINNQLPGKLTNLRAVNVDVSSVKLEWSRSRYAGTYTVEMNDGIGVWKQIYRYGNSITSAVINNLYPENNYSFRVKAVNSSGVSYSDIVSVKTNTIAPPTNINISSINSTSIKVQWEASPDAESYLVLYTEKEEGGFGYVETVETNAEISDLIPDTLYNIFVYSKYNDLYYSKPVCLFDQKTDIISAPRNFRAAAVFRRKAIVKWDPSPDAGAYQVSKSLDNENWDRTGGVLTNTELTVTELEPSTRYYLRVKTIKDGIRSNPSNIVTITTDPKEPPTPENLKCTETGLFSADLSWDETQYTHYYRVGMSTDGDNWDVCGHTDDADTTSIRISDLAPDTIYYFRVRACNDYDGNSLPTQNPIQVRTEAIDPPTGLYAASTFRKKVILKWIASPDAGTYQVSYRWSGKSDWDQYGEPVSNTELTVGGLSPDTRYYFRVKTLRGGYRSEASITAETVTDTLLPPIPENLRYTGFGHFNVSLAWDQTKYTNNYRIGKSTDNVNWSPCGTTNDDGGETTNIKITDLEPATTYYFRVIACNILDGNSAPSGSISVTTKPIAPATSLIIVNKWRYKVNLQWNASLDADSYQLLRSTDNSNWVKCGVVDSTSATVDGLNASTKYYFLVKAIKSGYRSEPTSAVSVTTDKATPTTPGNLRCTETKLFHIYLAWDDSRYADYYQAGKSTDNDNWGKCGRTDDASKTSIRVDSLKPDTLYYFRVKGVNGFGNSGDSNIITARTRAINPPENLRVTATRKKRVNLEWSASSDAEKYQVSLSRDGVNWDRTGGEITETTLLITELNPGTKYWFRVKALNSGYRSQSSNIVTARTASE